MDVHSGASWHIRLNDCSRRLFVGLPPLLATRPVPKLRWAILFQFSAIISNKQALKNIVKQFVLRVLSVGLTW